MSTELNILKVAILNEQEGYMFYKAAAERTTDETAKNAFMQFAQEEKAHETKLRKMYEQLRGTIRQAVYDPDGGYVQQPRIFRKNDTILTDDYELAVYRIGILMEEAAIRYYRESADRTSSPDVKKLLLELATWEESHRDALNVVYEKLRDEWWKKEQL